MIIRNHRLNIKGKWNSRCHFNALKLARKEGMELWVGFGVDLTYSNPGDEFRYFTHVFNMKDGIVIDNTWGAGRKLKYIYVGKKVDHKKFKSANAVWDYMEAFYKPGVRSLEELDQVFQN